MKYLGEAEERTTLPSLRLGVSEEKENSMGLTAKNT